MIRNEEAVRLESLLLWKTKSSDCARKELEVYALGVCDQPNSGLGRLGIIYSTVRSTRSL